MSNKRGDSPQDIPSIAVKFDSGKVRTHLFPVRAYLTTCQVFDYGAKKYDVGNWKRGNSFEYSRLIDALERHIKAFQLGQDNDPDTGMPHLAHAMCCLAMLLECTLTKTGTDDRDKAQITTLQLDDLGTLMVNQYNTPEKKT